MVRYKPINYAPATVASEDIVPEQAKFTPTTITSAKIALVIITLATIPPGGGGTLTYNGSIGMCGP